MMKVVHKFHHFQADVHGYSPYDIVGNYPSPHHRHSLLVHNHMFDANAKISFTNFDDVWSFG